MLKARFFLLPLLLLFCSGSLSFASPKPQANAEQNEFFESKIRPLLSSKCFACHGSEIQMAKLNMATAASFFKGGESGPVVVKGEPENSRLINAVNYQGQVKMPPTGKLKDAEIADLVAWIKIGAPWPDATAAEVAVEKPKGYQFTEQQKKFWAFQPVKDAAPPKVKNASWSKSPLDQFILAELEKKGLSPAQPASKLALLRRATFDLTGLPPTETKSKISSVMVRQMPLPKWSIACWPRRAMASAGAGIGWMWCATPIRQAPMKISGIPTPGATAITCIDAFNSDLPYNEFIKQQLAGDLLPAAKAGDVNTTGIIATGFFQVGPKLLAEQDKPKMVYDMVDEQLDVATRGLPGADGCLRPLPRP